MKKSKRILNSSISLILTISIMFTILAIGSPESFAEGSASLSTSEENITDSKIEIVEKEQTILDEDTKEIVKFVYQIFGEKAISSCEYMYNLDGNADYIAVEFVGGGYVIFAKDTMEMLEYNMQAELPYENDSAAKYYAGPANYFYKAGNEYLSAISGAKLEISAEEVASISSNIRTQIINSEATKFDVDISESSQSLSFISDLSSSTTQMQTLESTSSAPEIDAENLIPASCENGTLISNYLYFWARPTIGDNSGTTEIGNKNYGTCGPIAAQLLLGYNNFCVDRRIIPDRFLNGYDDVSETVIDPEKNPNYCEDPMRMTINTTGTRSENIGENSFYLDLVLRIMSPGAHSSTLSQITLGIDSYLGEIFDSSEYDVSYFVIDNQVLNPTDVVAEINAGRPIILSLDSYLNGSANHFVVAYGVQNYTYPDSNERYFGYVCHYGWIGDDYECIWINSSWCSGYVTLNINNHYHNYLSDGEIASTGKTAYKCSICNHRTDAAIRLSSTDGYVESSAVIGQGYYKEFYIKFDSAGYKMFQTFGSKDINITLYTTDYELLTAGDGSGFASNSLITYNAAANTAYILRVKNISYGGTVKFGIAPVTERYLYYDEFPNYSGTNFNINLSITKGTSYTLSFTPTVSGTYTIKTVAQGISYIDTCIYFIYAMEEKETVFNDDGGPRLQGLVSVELEAGKTYFVIISTYKIASEGTTNFVIQKNE